jgi:U3 small nucleolar ribonucleoprotein protein LCP5
MVNKAANLVLEFIVRLVSLPCLIQKQLARVRLSLRLSAFLKEGLITNCSTGKGKDQKPLPSHLLSDMSTSISSSTPYGESTSGLSVTVDPSLSSGTARHLRQVEDYELSNFTRMRLSKKEAKKRRAEEEEVAFGGLGSGQGGKRRLGGFGGEFDGLLGDLESGRSKGAYDQMKGFKRSKTERSTGGEEGPGSAGLAGMGEGKKSKRSKFDRAVNRSGSNKKR